MVAQIAEGTAFDKRGRPFPRRNYLPGAVMFLALAVVTLMVWVIALNRPADVIEVATCNPPPPAEPTSPPPDLGEQVSRPEMIDVTPAKLADTRLRVLNASGRGGQAADIANELRELGFPQPEATNDPVYTGARLECPGQIRFGPAGRAAAAALWLVAPCTELYQDARPDDTVDLALGTDFEELSVTGDTEAVLASLRPEATAPVDAELLTKIHTGAC